MKLNLGCGNNKIKDFVNVDTESSLKPDILADFLQPLPFKDETASEVCLFHTIEHIPEHYHSFVLNEVWRVLKLGGVFYISYPEFTLCAQNYIDNFQGKREFWKKTIYGRQLYKTDAHVALMNTEEFRLLLHQIGFTGIQCKAETDEPYNTVVKAVKDLKNYVNQETYNKLWYAQNKA